MRAETTPRCRVAFPRPLRGTAPHPSAWALAAMRAPAAAPRHPTPARSPCSCARSSHSTAAHGLPRRCRRRRQRLQRQRCRVARRRRRREERRRRVGGGHVAGTCHAVWVWVCARVHEQSMRASTARLPPSLAARTLATEGCAQAARAAQLNRMRARRDGCSHRRLAGTAPFFGTRPILVHARSFAFHEELLFAHWCGLRIGVPCADLLFVSIATARAIGLQLCRQGVGRMPRQGR